MPKLKAALLSHQTAVQRAAALKKHEQHAATKAASIKAGQSGLKKAAKKRARLEHAQAAGRDVDPDSRVAVAGDGDAGPSAARTTISTPKLEHKTASTAFTTGKGKSKATIPFSADDTILLLGEANFSFAVSLISPPHAHPGHQILATSYDSESVCMEKYADAAENVRRLREAGVGVEFGVDGGALEKCKRIGKGRWARVIMNFPHTGSGIKDQDRNIRDNQLLLLRVLRSVKPVLTSGPAHLLPGSHTGKPLPKKRKRTGGGDAEQDDEDDDDPAAEVSDIDNDEDGDAFNPFVSASMTTVSTSTFTAPQKPGTLLITLLDQPPYSLWSLRTLATRPPHVTPGTKLPQPKYKLLRSFKFDPGSYPGYAHRRTLGFKDGVSKADNEEILGRKGEARTWEFAPV